jgi:adenine-specific DNA-methyltransferase
MDYIGSKEKLNNWIFDIIFKDTVSNDLVFLDACSGSGSVSRFAASSGKFSKIISNDIMTFPSHIVRGSISLPRSQFKTACSLIQQINNLEGEKGFFYQNYSENSGRVYFSDENAAKIDAIRNFIERETPYGYAPIRSYLIYCVLEALSSVSNTTGIHAAFLKKLKPRACNPIIVKPEETLFKPHLARIYTRDILSLLKDPNYRNKYIEDIIYIDPPYNERQYGPNYHLYETFVKYDNPAIYGKTGLRDWKSESKSEFCSKKGCLEFLYQIYENTTASFMYISYSSDGIVSLDDMKLLFGSKMEVFRKDQRRYKADSSSSRTYDDSLLEEFLIKIGK